jgi:transcription-repair coupling factor (superfamily II helicase)
MMSNSYYSNIRRTDEYLQIIEALTKKENLILHNLEEEGILTISSIISSEEMKQVLIIVSDEVKAVKLYQKLSSINEKAYLLRAKQFALYGIDALSRENMNSRLAVIDMILKGENITVVASVEAYAHFLMDKKRFHEICFSIDINTTIEISNISSKLINMGFRKVSYIEGKGQFSIRGGIVDVYSPAEDNPCRIELFDNEIDSMRSFDIKTQRSIDNVKKYRIIPCCEIILNDNEINETKKSFEEDIRKRLTIIENVYDKNKVESNLKNLRSKSVNALENMEYIDNVEFYAPYMPIELYNFGDYLKKDALVIFYEPDNIKESRNNYKNSFIEKFADLYTTGQLLKGQEKIFYDFDSIIKNIKNNLSFIIYNYTLRSNSSFQVKKELSISSREVLSYHSKLDELAKDINRYKYKGYKIFLEVGKEEMARNLQNGLKEEGCIVSLSYSGDEEVLSGQSVITIGYRDKGIEFSDWKIIIISEKEIFGSRTKKKRFKKKQKASKIDSFTDLKLGDYVVHEYHGIGVYTGIEKILVKNIQKDYLCIHYKGKDKLYVPVDQMDLVQKYIGSDSIKPKLNKMGGTEWVKSKAKAQKAIDEIAEDLVELYAERMSKKGYAFSEDNEWQREFENAFEFQETEDQIRCTEEIKQDMMREVPMDRLLCGDVGFGKTEVALRAVFKAVMDGKQAAILVPTTILAQQHYSNIISRFSKYPVKIEMISRFRTAGQQRKIISDLNKGLIDVVIGTHKLLSKDIKFKDLGLLVIDEEQRFGVKHKEMIKQYKTNIDVLTLTATPIPRTLNMSMIGVRDMSIIEEPPKERYPVQTFVLEYNEGFIKEALIKELSRGGQAYYVHNRVNDIHGKASKVKEMIPEAKVAVAHGQMSERELENIMVDFISKEYDILVCTTIIETGMDISNVNTMIIDNADKLGLSQLYQLRGRVGRSNKTAFAYLTYEKNKILSEVAEKRLKAVKEFTEFGSGFKIAMRDLEIRGAGNILGSQQSGHLSAIGYDLYVKMTEKTLKRLSEKTEYKEEVQTIIEIDSDGYISSKYISDEEQKIEIYKKISSIENEDDVEDVTEEIIDRFGDIPKEVNNLITIAYIKSICKSLNIITLRQNGNTFIIEFKDANSITSNLIDGIMMNYKNDMKFEMVNKPIIKYKVPKSKVDGKEILSLLENTFKNLYNLNVNQNKENIGGKN